MTQDPIASKEKAMCISTGSSRGQASCGVLCAAFKAGQGAKANGIGSTVGLDKPCPALHTFGEVPAVAYQMQGFGDYREGDVASNCKQRDYKDGTDLVISAVDCRNYTEGGELNGTLQAKPSGGYSYNLQNTVRTGAKIRRLTPLECERLQGYPDGWTDIGEWRDSKGKPHKPSDAPRYRALGNSIALPFWRWMLRRMAVYLPPRAALGSLFDGIGGFPLLWEEIHGPGTAVWASEIEEFAIAVTRRHFPDGNHYENPAADNTAAGRGQDI